MDDSRPTPHGRPEPAAAPAPAGSTTHTGPSSRRPSRRSVLAGGAVVVLAAAGGTAAGFLPDHDARPPAPNPAPRALMAAAARERALIADLDATTGGAPALRMVLLRARADHAAHLAAFQRLLAGYDPHTPPSGQTSEAAGPSAAEPIVHGSPRTAAQLLTAENTAAKESARAAAASSGRLAVLLASVSASESSHAELIG